MNIRQYIELRWVEPWWAAPVILVLTVLAGWKLCDLTVRLQLVKRGGFE